MKKYAKMELGELVNITGGGTPSRAIPEYWGGDIPWVTVKDFISKTITGSQEKITPIGLKKSASNLIPINSILMPTRMGLGKIGINEVPVAINQDIKALQIIDKEKLDLNFLALYLSTISTVFEKAGKGATVKGIKLDFLKGINIPLPTLDDQIRIATILTRVEKLIAKRKENIQALDELVKSAFAEMFGNQVRNENGWERVTIRDLIIEAKYGTSKSADGGKYKYLRMNNITHDGYWDFSNLKYIEIEDSDKAKYVLQKNDLVFNRTNSKELVGKTAVFCLDEEVIIAGYLIRMRTKADVNPWYIWGYLNSKAGKLRLFNLCRNIVGMANINAQELQNIPILKPPFQLQNQFAAIVEKVESLKEKYTKNLIELENLYGSLSQRAFIGELDLNKIPVQQNSYEGVNETTIMRDTDVELKSKNDFTDECLIEQIKKYSGSVFSFDELWEDIRLRDDINIPSRNELQSNIIRLLESDNSDFRQVFGILTSEMDKELMEKQIAFERQL